MDPIRTIERPRTSYGIERDLREREHARLTRLKRSKWRLALARIVAGQRGARSGRLT